MRATRARCFLVGGLLAALAAGLTACADVTVDPYAPPADPVDLIIVASGFPLEGSNVEVYLAQVVDYRTAIVTGGRFTVSFQSALDAHATRQIDLEVFSDDDPNLCCDLTRDTLIRQTVEVVTGAEAAVHVLDFFDDTLVGSDCTFFLQCAP